MADASKDPGANQPGTSQTENQRTWDELVRIHYPRWHQLAEALMRRERPGHTLQATALLSQAILEIMETNVQTEQVGSVTALVKEKMKRILVEHARRRNADKRFGAKKQVPLHQVEELLAMPAPDLDLEGYQRFLAELGICYDQRGQALWLQICKYSNKEIAKELGVSVSSIEKYLRSIKALIKMQMERGNE
jgi:DNA-directed RNA polymerase specialized sigma24 family protein